MLADEIVSALRRSDRVKMANKDGLHGALLSLASKDIATFTISTEDKFSVTAAGEAVLKNGSDEYLYFQTMSPSNANGKKLCFKLGWIKIDQGVIKKTRESVTDEIQKILKNFIEKDSGSVHAKELLRRKFIRKYKTNTYLIERGAVFTRHIDTERHPKGDLINDITADVIAKGLIGNLKDYNWNTTGNIPICGSLHPLRKWSDEIRRIFVEMGFYEMDTSSYVESCFWNFDALFQPQNHPSREEQDTFFIKNKLKTEIPEEYKKRVERVHSKGGYGSRGYQTKWSSEEALKMVLRTHTTACTAKTLFLNKEKELKMFSIDRVFRNETVDKTHLAEFNQIEGFVLGTKLGIRDLLGMLGLFYKKLGISKIKFKPAYNPYTEPSIEVFGFHSKYKKWVEIGNSGVFRREMLEPMGYTNDQTVIAWGLSLERSFMIRYGIGDIREVFGFGVKIDDSNKFGIVHIK